MGVNHHHEQRQLRDTDTHTYGNDNARDNTDAYRNSYASDTDANGDTYYDTRFNGSCSDEDRLARPGPGGQ
jgi:hypothetical protein